MSSENCSICGYASLAGQHELCLFNQSKTREQRRYEIARDVLAAWVRYSGFGDAKHNAKMAVYCADALLKELEKT